LPRVRRRVVNDDVLKLATVLFAVYGVYKSARTAWRLGFELFG